MHALAIVTLTLSGLAGVLFGSDLLDRRLTIRSSGSVEPLAPAAATAADEPAVAPVAAPAPTATGRHASAMRPVAPCHHCRGPSTTMPATKALRTPGPLRVAASH